jgi:hypothetical protein
MYKTRGKSYKYNGRQYDSPDSDSSTITVINNITQCTPTEVKSVYGRNYGYRKCGMRH